MTLSLPILLLMVLVLSACSRQSPPSTNEGGKQPEMKINITSSAFQDGGLIPSKYTCDGADVSPPLQWSGIPQDTKFLALICDDPDAPAKTWVHWVVYDLPPNIAQLPEAVPDTESLAAGGKQGRNDFGKIGYGGPCPPGGTHRYFFKLYALASQTSLQPGATKEQLLKAIEGKVLGQGQLMGTYKRR
jgi:Raf kinase inhibitor-like YbhB/YbcL family protein